MENMFHFVEVLSYVREMTLYVIYCVIVIHYETSGSKASFEIQINNCNNYDAY